MRVVDLFAGCGGMSRGFENAGFEAVAAFELWNIAADCYSRNFSHPVYRNDLSDIATAIPIIKSFDPDLIIGGPPCQDFSHAGKRVESDRADLTLSYAKIVDSIRPTAFVMENVDRVISSHAYAKARGIYKNAEYGLTELILDASLCGVPQKRKRFFCIGILGEKDNFLLDSLLNGLSKLPTTLRDYFGSTLDFDFYYRHPRNYSRRAIFSVDEPAPTMRGVNRPVPKGYLGHPNDAAPLTSNLRCLTTLERALIQTFPADFKWIGNKTEMEQMIGNAVPIKLAEYVASCLKNHLDERCHKHAPENEFIRWLIQNKNYSDRSARDVLSRIKRASQICPLCDDLAFYIYKLEQTIEYNSLTVSVRSQIKKALSLNAEFIKTA